MAPTKNVAGRDDSVSPKNVKAEVNADKTKHGGANGAVQPALKSSKASNGVTWKGPQPDTTLTSTNGDPFKKTAIPLMIKTDGGRPSPVSLLCRNSEADDKPSRPVIVCTPTAAEQIIDKGKGKAQVSASQQPVGTRGQNYNPNSSPTHSNFSDFFTTDVGPGVVSPGGHYIKVSLVLDSRANINDALNSLHVDLGLEGKITGSAVTGPGQDTNNTQIVFRFDDIRDAAKTIDDVTMVDTRWAAVYITQQEYEAAVKQRGHGRETHFYDGQVVFVARPAGEGVHLDHACLYDEIVSLVKRFGRVLIIAPADIVKGTWNVRAEYMRISDAKMAIETLTKHAPEELTGWTVIARQRQLVAHGGASINKIATTPHRNAHGMPGEYVESPTGRTAFMRDEDGNPIPMPPPRVIPRVMHQSEPYSEREQSAPTPQTPRTKEVYNPRNLPAAATRGHGSDPRHNQRHDNFVPRESQALDLERVRNGVDVRTSLMLRNIPSCMDSARLIKIFNSHNKGRYNFTYLRFDFGNGCNVGYAFVNFVNPDDVLKFGDNWMGAPWMSELPARVNGRSQLAEISYAHCQGVDGAIERFRNSSVMDEVPGYRPQLWYTKEDAPHPKMVGTEAPFPNHNNEVKLDRSRGNATQHGLYSPAKRNGRGGPQGRSQYDPGTLSQIREDEEFEQSQAQAYAPHQQMAGPSMMMFAPPQNQMHPVAFNTPNGIVFAYPNAVNHQGQMMYAEPHPINDPFHPAAYSYADAQMYGGHHPNSPYFYQPSSPYGNQHGSPYAQQQGSPYAQHNGPHAQHNSLYYQRNGPYVQPNSPQHGTQYGYHHNGVQNGNGHHNGNHHQRGNGSAQYGGGYPDNGHVQNGGFNRNGAAYGEQFDEEYSSYAQHDNDSGDGQRFKPRHP